jgi:hypothetical protein
MYHWELADSAEPEFANLSQAIQAALTAFMDAAVLVDPIQYQRHLGEPTDPPALLRTLHFGQHHEGLVTFLVYPPDDLVLVVKIQWLSE